MKFFKKIKKIIYSIEEFIIDIVSLVFGKKTKSHSRKVLIEKIVFFGLSFCMLGFGVFLLWFSSIEIPDLASFDQRMLGQSTKIYDRTGKILLYDLSKNMRRTVVPFDQISQNVKNATIAIEDSSFYNHNGIKISSIFRALLADIYSFDFAQGGSTITQQVIKNSLLTQEKTITRKIKEVFLAIKLEKTLTKDQILNLYLNEAPYGGKIYGIEEASEAYFNKKSIDLTIAESAYLASIPKSPTKYSPFGNHKEDLEIRKNLTLTKMKELSLINEAEYTEAKNEKVKFQEQLSGGIKAPHFVMYIKDYLEEKYGDKLLNEGGIKVTTTLDYDLQQKAEEIVKRKALENGKLYHATNAALVALDVKTGQILTMVGSRDYFDEEVDGNYNVATAKRQPGSSFKPIVYAKAFEMGYTPDTILFDVPTQFSPSCSATNLTSNDPCYSPSNYDGKFRGPMTLRNALAQSINIPAVKLLYLVGMDNVLDLAQKLGITTLNDRSRFGLSLVLGGGEVTLLEMTGAYGVFANNGIKTPETGILKIEDKLGRTLEEWKENNEKVFDKQTTLTLSDVLSDNVARTPSFGAASSLYFPGRQVAAKTGTTNNYRDTWVIGYTPQIAVGAWAGNNDNTPIDRKVAGYIVAPMWHEFMNELLKILPDERFEQPEKMDTSNLKPVLRGVWQDAQNGVHSILYYIDPQNPLGKQPSNPERDPQFKNWEYAVQKWIDGEGIQTQTNTNSKQSVKTSNINVSITSPSSGSKIKSGDTITARVKIISEAPVVKVIFILNNTVVGTAESAPYETSFVVNKKDLVSDTNTLRAVVIDSLQGQQSSSIILTNKVE